MKMLSRVCVVLAFNSFLELVFFFFQIVHSFEDRGTINKPHAPPFLGAMICQLLGLHRVL